MALDLSKPLRRKDTGSPVVLLENSGELAYAVKKAGKWDVRYVAEAVAHDYLENVPERRALDAVLHFDATGRIVRVLNCLTGQEIDIAGTSVAAKRIQTTYEVGEGLS